MRFPAATGDYAIAWVATLLFFGAFYALLVPLPLYLTRIGLPDWQVGVILGAFGVASLVSRPVAGVFTDAWDRERVMRRGAAALIAGATGVTLTTWPLLLVVMRILQATPGTWPLPRRPRRWCRIWRPRSSAVPLSPASVFRRTSP